MAITIPNARNAQLMTTASIRPFRREPAATPPPQPDDPTVSNITATTADVNWTEPLDDGGSPITAILVQWGPVGGPYTDEFDADLASPHPLTGLTASTNYEVRVRADNAEGTGTFSNFVPFTTTA